LVMTKMFGHFWRTSFTLQLLELFSILLYGFKPEEKKSK